jgi:rod shape-determining protein MreC
LRDRRYMLWMLVLVLVVILNLPLPASMRVRSAARDGFAPFQNVLALVWHRAAGVLASVGNRTGVVEEREKLLQENATLRQRIRRLEGFERENQALRRQLGISILSPRNLLFCEVIARGDLSGWWQTIHLGKGLDHGVRQDMAVITDDGLVGRVRSVSRRTCEVLLVSDPNCRVACRVVRTGAFGVMRGAGMTLRGDTQLELLATLNPCRMDYVPRAGELQKGDRIETSGLGGVFPEGILVGEVLASGVAPRIIAVGRNLEISRVVTPACE